LFDSTLEAPNKAVARMMVLSQLCRNFATAPLVDRADKLVVCCEGDKPGG
jgi:lipopolysaccharide biosynthesis regulator YciM